MAKLKKHDYLTTEVSVYKAVTNKKGNTVYVPNGFKMLKDVLTSSETDRLVKLFRTTNDPKIKKRIQTFTPVGKYGTERKMSVRPDACTNLVQIDIDSKVNPQIKNWPKFRDHLFNKYEWIAVVGLSCSGAGLFILAHTTAWESYVEHFNHIAELLNKNEELNIDLAVGSPNELRYCTLSTDVMLRTDAKIYKGLKEKEVNPIDNIVVKGDGEIIPVDKATYGTWHYNHLASYLGKSIANAVPKEAVIAYMQKNCKKFFDKASGRFGDTSIIREQIETFYETYGDQFGAAKKAVRAHISTPEEAELLDPAVFEDLDFVKTNQTQRQIMIIDAVLDKYKVITTAGGVHFYTGTHWQLMADSTVEKFLMSAAQQLGAEPGEVRHYRFSEDMLNQLKKHTQHRLESAANKLNLLNGTYDTNDNKIHPHREEDYLFYVLPYELDTKAKCPKFDKYMATVLPKVEYQNLILSYVASCFSTVKLEKMLCLFGSGANGKSVLLDILKGILGKENCTYVPIDSLAAEGSRGENSRTMIHNKLINFSYESKLNRIDFSTFKMLASREPLQARFMYNNPFFMENYARTIYSVNSLPTHLESTAGLFRRLLIVPFETTIPKEKQNKRLAEQIVREEAPGVLNKVLEALKRFNKNENLEVPEALDTLIDELETETDNVKLFLKESNYEADTKTKPGDLPTLKDLYFEYKNFCDEAGITGGVGRTTFIRRLARFNIRAVRGGKGPDSSVRLTIKKGA